MIILVALAITGVTYGLIQINNSAETSENATAKIQIDDKPKTEAKKPTKLQVKPLPTKPKEQWSYIENLPQKKVEVELPEAKQNTRPYLMQCGSFRSSSDAQSLKVRIAFQGLQSEVRHTTGSNGAWYRVVLGPYPTKRGAEKDRHILQRANIQGCQIWFW